MSLVVGLRDLRGRYRRRTLLLVVLVVAVVSGVAVVAVGARPGGETSTQIALEQGRVGTTYAFDGVVCLGSPVAGSTVEGVEVRQSPGGTTRLVRPEGPVTLGFPVDDDAGGDPTGYDVPAGETDCGLRVLVTPDRQGRVAAGTLEVELSYGPGRLLRRTVTVTPDVVLDVTGTGPDPRLSPSR